jgi:hypothetical protein
MEQIKPGMKTSIRGGEFTVRDFTDGMWNLEMKPRILRKDRVIRIRATTDQVLLGIQELEAEETVKRCSRASSLKKEIAQQRFLPRERPQE